MLHLETIKIIYIAVWIGEYWSNPNHVSVQSAPVKWGMFLKPKQECDLLQRYVFNYLWSSTGLDLGDMSKSSGLNNVFLGSGELHQPSGPAVLLQVQSHCSHAEVQETLQGWEHHLPHPILCYHPEQDSQTHSVPRWGRWVFSSLTCSRALKNLSTLVSTQ